MEYVVAIYLSELGGQNGKQFLRPHSLMFYPVWSFLQYGVLPAYAPAKLELGLERDAPKVVVGIGLVVRCLETILGVAW